VIHLIQKQNEKKPILELARYCLFIGFVLLTKLDCHECHIAFLNANNVEVEYELGEYCESESTRFRSKTATMLTEAQVVGNDTIPAATV
jgi:hypothetical protein